MGLGAGWFGVSENRMRAEGPSPTSDSLTHTFLTQVPWFSPAGHSWHHVLLLSWTLSPLRMDGRVTPAQLTLLQETPACPLGLHQELRVGSRSPPCAPCTGPGLGSLSGFPAANGLCWQLKAAGRCWHGRTPATRGQGHALSRVPWLWPYHSISASLPCLPTSLL